MSNAKAEIFAAIRKSLPSPSSATNIAEALAALRNRVNPTRPDRVNGAPDEVFLARVQSPGVAASAERIANLDNLPAAVARYVSKNNLPPSIALQPHPDLQGLNWSGLHIHHDIATDEPVAVGLALGGIAETGTLVFHSQPHSPTLFAFLPLHHIVAVYAETIWPWLEDYTAEFVGQTPPRNINFVTGASGTTDIEGTLVRGAHGPGWLHIILVEQ
ncbi:MAG: hypothetical protein B7Z75_07225 [Acidocella sp. 20-57-95]|nr:MAG: hypothetical protein B7Z75_07225 [Acidocella sp. 20-57-95]OYV62646.1 MAG: hypothetical protein B7Z71_00420 [Acidocella sp. 21-58-7]HQT63533.1 LUD domain-containing protein [Acidocella sp.]HQU03295.1 LUD domain-containing protein [Acidocella sp.]